MEGFLKKLKGNPQLRKDKWGMLIQKNRKAIRNLQSTILEGSLQKDQCRRLNVEVYFQKI